MRSAPFHCLKSGRFRHSDALVGGENACLSLSSDVIGAGEDVRADEDTHVGAPREASREQSAHLPCPWRLSPFRPSCTHVRLTSPQ